MTERDLERIARGVLRELGAGDVSLVVTRENGGDRWRIAIDIDGRSEGLLHIRAGAGTTAQFVREQIFEQFERR